MIEPYFVCSKTIVTQQQCPQVRWFMWLDSTNDLTLLSFLMICFMEFVLCFSNLILIVILKLIHFIAFNSILLIVKHIIRFDIFPTEWKSSHAGSQLFGLNCQPSDDLASWTDKPADNLFWNSIVYVGLDYFSLSWQNVKSYKLYCRSLFVEARAVILWGCNFRVSNMSLSRRFM